MAKIIIMSGLPASGKSTAAQALLNGGGNFVRLNKDLLRTMLHFDKFNHTNEGHTWNAEVSLAVFFLTSNINVVIDDTNLNPKTMQRWKDLAKQLDVKIQYADMDVGVEECIERDSKREKRVGKHVIEKMALQYKGYLKGERVIICDLDGTMCNIDHRLHFVQGEKKDWDSFFNNMMSDTPREEVKSEVISARLDGCKIIFVSARPEKYREVTMEWLRYHVGLEEYSLIMRENGDSRPDTVVKAEIYDKYLKHLTILKIYDDRPSVIRMWREKGLNVIDVGKGIEF